MHIVSHHFARDVIRTNLGLVLSKSLLFVRQAILTIKDFRTQVFIFLFGQNFDIVYNMQYEMERSEMECNAPIGVISPSTSFHGFGTAFLQKGICSR